MNEKLIQTYVRHNDQWFFVSTINRESSIPMDPAPWFAETLVWKIDKNNHREKLIAQGGDIEGFIDTHLSYVKQLRLHGEITEQ